ncbi:MAG: hypothetical protein MJ225_00930 [Bacilli bacterium]|nr:hypothetical protein [Bacilli bacterium]
MIYKVVISEDAKNSILDSIRFLANVNKNSADKELSVIFKEIKSLEEFPFRYQVVEGLTVLGKQIRKFVLPNGRYIVLYSVNETTVFVDKFLDSRRENKLVSDLINF